MMNRLRQNLFTLRSYTPLPFLALMIIFAQPTVVTMTAGFCLVAAGELSRFYGVAYAGSLTRVTGSVGAPAVIVAGPFAFVRNPLYIGNMLTYIGIGLMANALFPWLVLAALFWFSFQYYEIVLAEEAFLEQEFGAAYLEFKQHVPRFVPRLVPYRTAVQELQRPNWQEAVRSERRTFQALALVLACLCVLWSLR
jgi:protein-S-isoprenylcysteine O-methyltransferase Ste14